MRATEQEPVLQGIIPALHAPFDAHEELAPAMQRRLVARLLEEGVQGLFLCGTSAEFPYLDLAERKQIVELVAAEVSGQAALIVHVGAPRPAAAVELARHAARLGARALSSVPPYYYAYTRAAILDYIREVAGATELPFYYYHIPPRTGVELDEAFVRELIEVPNVVGMKFSSADLGLERRIQEIAGERFHIFCGCDELLLAALKVGARGGIGSTYNFLAPTFLTLWQAYQRGDLQEAESLEARANRLISVLARYPGIAASKAALRLLGLDLGLPRRPQSRLGPGELAAFEGEILAAGLREIGAGTPRP